MRDSDRAGLSGVLAREARRRTCTASRARWGRRDEARPERIRRRERGDLGLARGYRRAAAPREANARGAPAHPQLEGVRSGPRRLAAAPIVERYEDGAAPTKSHERRPTRQDGRGAWTQAGDRRDAPAARDPPDARAAAVAHTRPAPVDREPLVPLVLDPVLDGRPTLKSRTVQRRVAGATRMSGPDERVSTYVPLPQPGSRINAAAGARLAGDGRTQGS